MYDIDTVKRVQIGVSGEGLVTKVEFDVSRWLELLPDATYSVHYKRPESDTMYQPTIALDRDEGVLTWTVSGTDTANEGVGELEVQALDSTTNACKKSNPIDVLVNDTMHWTGEQTPSAPDPLTGWATRLANLESAVGDAVDYAYDKVDEIDSEAEDMVDRETANRKSADAEIYKEIGFDLNEKNDITATAGQNINANATVINLDLDEGTVLHYEVIDTAGVFTSTGTYYAYGDNGVYIDGPASQVGYKPKKVNTEYTVTVGEDGMHKISIYANSGNISASGTVTLHAWVQHESTLTRRISQLEAFEDASQPTIDKVDAFNAACTNGCVELCAEGVTISNTVNNDNPTLNGYVYHDYAEHAYNQEKDYICVEVGAVNCDGSVNANPVYVYFFTDAYDHSGTMKRDKLQKACKAGSRNVFHPTDADHPYTAYAVRLYPAQTSGGVGIPDNTPCVYERVSAVNTECPDGYIELNGVRIENDPVPAYYHENNYLDTKIATIKSKLDAAGGNADAFFFVTDTHSEWNNLNSIPVIKYMSERLPIKRLIHGGDTADVIDTAYAKRLREAFSGDVHFVAGNHEYFYNTTEGAVYDAFNAYNTDHIGNAARNYYWFDDAEKHIRYIVLNAYAHNGTEGSNAAAWGLEQTQLDWFRDYALSIDAGWTAIVFCHAIRWITGSDTTYTWNYSGAETLAGIMDAYNTAHSDRRIAFAVQGHTHCDRIMTTTGGIKILCTTCDKNKYKDAENKTQVYDGRDDGTIGEMAMDVVIVNTATGSVEAVRVGVAALDAIGSAYTGSSVQVRSFEFTPVARKYGDRVDALRGEVKEVKNDNLTQDQEITLLKQAAEDRLYKRQTVTENGTQTVPKALSKAVLKEYDGVSKQNSTHGYQLLNQNSVSNPSVFRLIEPNYFEGLGKTTAYSVNDMSSIDISDKLVDSETYTISVETDGLAYFGIRKKANQSATGYVVVKSISAENTRSTVTFTYSYDEENPYVYVVVQLNPSTTLHDDVSYKYVKIMLEKGTVAHGWQPYTGGMPSPSPSYPQEIVTADVTSVVSNGKNLFNPSTVNGGKWLNSETGELENSSPYFVTDYIRVHEGFTYLIPLKGTVRNWLYDMDKNPVMYIPNNGAQGVYTVPSDGYIRLCAAKNTISVGDFIFCVYGTDNSYTPYRTPITYTIPSSVRTQYPLRSAGNVHDSITYDGEKWWHTKRVGNINLGTLNWYLTGKTSLFGCVDANNSYGIKRSESYSIVSNLTCCIYSADSHVNVYSLVNDKRIASMYDNTGFYLYDTSYSDVISLKSSLANVLLYYQLATPIVTDITSLMNWDGVLSVESGGTVQFVQADTEFDIPNSVSYLVPQEYLSGVSVGGTALTPVDGVVDVPVASNTNGNLGLCKFYGSGHQVNIGSDGLVSLKDATTQQITGHTSGFAIKSKDLPLAVKSVMTASTSTTDPAWTDAEKHSACERMGAERRLKDGWVLKGTMTNVNGITVDLTGCTELYIYGWTVGTAATNLMANGSKLLVVEVAYNGTRSSILLFKDCPFGLEAEHGKFMSTTKTPSSFNTNYGSFRTMVNFFVSDITTLSFSSNVVTECELKIYAR